MTQTSRGNGQPTDVELAQAYRQCLCDYNELQQELRRRGYTVNNFRTLDDLFYPDRTYIVKRETKVTTL